MFQLMRLAVGSIVVMFVIAGAFMRVQPAVAPDAAPTHHSTNPWASDAPEPTSAAPLPAAGGETIALVRDRTGQFHLDAQVNGQRARFLVDTGADTVAIGEGEAQRLGIDTATLDFAPIVQTASGEGMGARVTIDRMTIGNADLGAVSAIVIRDLPVNLLGQSVLRRLGKVEMSGDRMTIQPG